MDNSTDTFSSVLL